MAHPRASWDEGAKIERWPATGQTPTPVRCTPAAEVTGELGARAAGPDGASARRLRDMVKEARNRRGYGHDRHIGGDAARDGLDRRDRRARECLLGCSDAAQPAELQDRRRAHAAAADPGARHHQAGGGAGERRSGPARCRGRRGNRYGRGRGHRGRARRPLPPRRLANRLGHPEQHERQRGDRKSRLRDSRPADGPEDPGPPQRPRQPEPVVQRHLPDRDAHRRR